MPFSGKRDLNEKQENQENIHLNFHMISIAPNIGSIVSSFDDLAYRLHFYFSSLRSLTSQLIPSIELSFI